MENVAEALQIGFAVMVFVIALSVVFSMVSQAKQTADIVFSIEDDSKYFQDGLEGVTYLTSGTTERTERIVGWETVVPTIYRYNKEEYGVTIIDNTKTELDKIIARFDYDTESIVQNWTDNNKTYGEEDESNPNNILIKYLNNQVFTKYLGSNLNEYDNSAYTDLFERIYKAESYSTGNTPGAPWLNTNMEDLKKRLELDLGKNTTPYKFGENSINHTYNAKYTGLHLADKYADKEFKEIIYTIDETQPNGEVKPKVEIIYEVQ